MDTQAWTFTPWSHAVAMTYAQLSHSFGLNDVRDALRLQVTALFATQGHASGPQYAQPCQQATRCVFAAKFFWKMLGHLQTQHAGFGCGGKNTLTWRFRRAIQISEVNKQVEK